MPEANIQDVRKYLAEGQERPLGMAEFKAFWEACSDQEKADIKKVVSEKL